MLRADNYVRKSEKKRRGDNVKYTVESDIGRKRSINEDRAAFVTREDGLQMALVADGMGGHNAGDVASQMAAEEARELFLQAKPKSFATSDKKKEWLLETVKKLNKTLYRYASNNPDCSGMGTTLILVLIDDLHCLIAHVGDSRVYHFYDNKVKQITKDHSYVNALVESGEISVEEAKNHPKKNVILKALGTDIRVEPDIYEITLTKHSYVLVCSDGLSNKVTMRAMGAVIFAAISLEDKGKQLVQLANESGGEDNISLVLLMKEGEG